MFFKQPDTDKVTKLKKDIKIYKDQRSFNRPVLKLVNAKTTSKTIK